MFGLWLYKRMEYFTGVGGYIGVNLSIDSIIVDRFITGAISFVFGILLVIVTHFLKRWLNRKAPIK